MSSSALMQALAKRFGGIFIESRYDEEPKAKIVFDQFEIVFDYYVHYSDRPQQLFTRISARFISDGNFEFELYRLSFFSKMGKFLGLIKDIEIGEKDFDSAFVIKSNDGFKIKSLLRNKNIRNLIAKQRKINFSISTDKGIWGGKLPSGHFELGFYTAGKITDINRFDSLFELFKLTLIQMKEIGVIKRGFTS